MDERDLLWLDVDRWQSEGGAVARNSEAAVLVAPRLWGMLVVARKVGIAVAGGVVFATGVALLFLPGPAIVVIPLGLAILATEFLWARRLLHRARAQGARLFTRRRSPTAG